MCDLPYAPPLAPPSHLFSQGPAQYFESKGDSEREVAEGEKGFALFGFVVTLGMFFGYLYYQWKLSLDSNDDVGPPARSAPPF